MSAMLPVLRCGVPRQLSEDAFSFRFVFSLPGKSVMGMVGLNHSF